MKSNIILPVDIKVTEISLFNSTWICEKEPCVVYKGHNVSINISFENVGKYYYNYLEIHRRTTVNAI